MDKIIRTIGSIIVIIGVAFAVYFYMERRYNKIEDSVTKKYFNERIQQQEENISKQIERINGLHTEIDKLNTTITELQKKIIKAKSGKQGSDSIVLRRTFVFKDETVTAFSDQMVIMPMEIHRDAGRVQFKIIIADREAEVWETAKVPYRIPFKYKGNNYFFDVLDLEETSIGLRVLLSIIEQPTKSR